MILTLPYYTLPSHAMLHIALQRLTVLRFTPHCHTMQSLALFFGLSGIEPENPAVRTCTYRLEHYIATHIIAPQRSTTPCHSALCITMLRFTIHDMTKPRIDLRTPRGFNLRTPR